MGWWGVGPTEGDTPMDVESIIRNVVKFHATRAPEGVSSDDEGFFDFEIKTVDEVNRVIAAKDEITDRVLCAGEEDIFWHGLAAAVMRSGGPLASIKDEVLKAIDGDEWAQTDDRREAAMDAFRAQVVAHVDGVVSVVPTKGLLEAIDQHLASGKRGLVNR